MSSWRKQRPFIAQSVRLRRADIEYAKENGINISEVCRNALERLVKSERHKRKTSKLGFKSSDGGKSQTQDDAVHKLHDGEV